MKTSEEAVWSEGRDRNRLDLDTEYWPATGGEGVGQSSDENCPPLPNDREENNGGVTKGSHFIVGHRIVNSL